MGIGYVQDRNIYCGLIVFCMTGSLCILLPKKIWVELNLSGINIGPNQFFKLINPCRLKRSNYQLDCPICLYWQWPFEGGMRANPRSRDDTSYFPLQTSRWGCLHALGKSSLQWRHNGRDGVSNHQPPHCLLNRLFRSRSNKTSKLRVTGHCVGNSPETGEFPTQLASNAENVSIWWRHPGSSQNNQLKSMRNSNSVTIVPYHLVKFSLCIQFATLIQAGISCLVGSRIWVTKYTLILPQGIFLCLYHVYILCFHKGICWIYWISFICNNKRDIHKVNNVHIICKKKNEKIMKPKIGHGLSGSMSNALMIMILEREIFLNDAYSSSSVKS